mgnify:CR=1 FL=1
MKIGIDIGYGFTKAVNEDGLKVIFPSLVAHAGHDALGGIFSQTQEYRVSIAVGHKKAELLVGEAARHSFVVSQALNKEKPPELHDPLLLTAIGLLGQKNSEISIGVGLPLAYYASQKEELQNRLKRLSTCVTVKGIEQYISNLEVQVLPQGAGVLLKAGNQLPSRGYIGVVDPGTYTTEYLLFEMKDGQPVPILEACGSVEIGTNLVYSAVAREFQAQTGSPLPIGMEHEITQQALSREAIRYYGKSYYLDDVVYTARKNVSTALSQKVLAAWGNRTGYIQYTFLAGGGPLFFGSVLHKSFPCSVVVDEPVFANADGYLAFL